MEKVTNNANLRVHYLSEAQMTSLLTNGSITVDGKTINFDPNSLHFVLKQLVLGVKINGVTVPISDDGSVNLVTATATDITNRTAGKLLDASNTNDIVKAGITTTTLLTSEEKVSARNTVEASKFVMVEHT